MAWTELFVLTVDEWQTWSKRLGENVMFTRRGYSVVSEAEKSEAMLHEGLKVQKSLGVNSWMLSRREIDELLPAINKSRVRAVQHQPDGGVAPHHAVMKGLLAFCQRNGVDVRYRTAITGLERTGITSLRRAGRRPPHRGGLRHLLRRAEQPGCRRDGRRAAEWLRHAHRGDGA